MQSMFILHQREFLQKPSAQASGGFFTIVLRKGLLSGGPSGRGGLDGLQDRGHPPRQPGVPGDQRNSHTEYRPAPADGNRRPMSGRTLRRQPPVFDRHGDRHGCTAAPVQQKAETRLQPGHFTKMDRHPSKIWRQGPPAAHSLYFLSEALAWSEFSILATVSSGSFLSVLRLFSSATGLVAASVRKSMTRLSASGGPCRLTAV